MVIVIEMMPRNFSRFSGFLGSKASAEDKHRRIGWEAKYLRRARGADGLDKGG
jgi:hypothetical protein